MRYDQRLADRRRLLRRLACAAGAVVASCVLDLRDESRAFAAEPAPPLDDTRTKDWLPRWQKSILGEANGRACDREIGEEIGWLLAPILNGFYYGYLATQDIQWIERLVDWSDSWMKRGVKEPDGYVGWPKASGAATGSVPDFITDNMLGEAMGLHPALLAAGAIRKTPALQQKYGEKADQHIALSEKIFAKWDARGAWREVKEGGLWVVPNFGLDAAGQWTKGYEQRNTDGFSLPDNKQNFIALWLLAMHDVTGKPLYKERAEKWFRVMKSRMKLQQDGKYFVWNYWDVGGPWDFKPDGARKHWVGVHPNGGYYGIDLEGIVAAYEHSLVFDKQDIDRLIATNRDFMWNQKVEGAKFQRIDAGTPTKPWLNSPGVLWEALVPYDPALRKIFEANHDAAGWGGLASTPRYIAWERGRLPAHP